MTEKTAYDESRDPLILLLHDPRSARTTFPLYKDLIDPVRKALPQLSIQTLAPFHYTTCPVDQGHRC